MNQQSNSNGHVNANGNGASNATAVPMTGKAIRQLRRSLSLTQSAFAAQLGVRRLTVLRWEAGQHTPLPEHVRLLNQLHELNSRALTAPAPRTVAPRSEDGTEQHD